MDHMSDKKSYSTTTPSQEDSREHEKVSHQRGAHLAFIQVGRPWRVPPVSFLHKLVLHRLRVFIFAVDQARFDPRAPVHPTGLYKQELTPWLRASSILGRNPEPPLQSRNPR
jgi:hypothetical protein